MSKQINNPEYEHSHYEYPIPSREAIRAVLGHKPLTSVEVSNKLQAASWAKDAICKRLDAMCRDRQVEKNDSGYFLKGKSKLIESEVLASKSGDLSVQVDGLNLLLSYRHSQGLFPHDRIVVRVPDPVDARSNPIPVKVMKSSSRHIVCYVDLQRGKKRLVPFDRRIKHLLEIKDIQKFSQEDVILVARSEVQKNRRVLNVSFVKILGAMGDPGIEREIARSLYHLPQDWLEVEISQSQDEIDAQRTKRTDWSHLPFVTIDGDDAKDYDDAVYAEKTETGYCLYVAIADVSYYVTPGSTIDQQAQLRGNSVYFPGYVIPMLPTKLSNDLCSLMPNVNRLAMGVRIDLNQEGQVMAVHPERVLIRSHARLTYTQVEEIFEKSAYPEGLADTLSTLDEVAKKLQKLRIQKGAIMFSSQELIFDFDSNQQVRGVSAKDRGWSHQLIEECMLCANCSVGRYLLEHHKQFIKRAHHAPSTDKAAFLAEYLETLGVKLSQEPKPKDLQRALEEVPGHRRDEAESMMLRTMSQAFYSTSDQYHYALSVEGYTHFTSPIRRYVDLTVHRALLDVLKKRDSEANSLESYARDCSLSERFADEASWFVQAWLKTSLMTKHIGQKFSGTISAVTHFGIFVRLDDMPIEGLVHISQLGDDHYVFEQHSLCLRGRSTGQTFIQGKRITILVKSASLMTQQIDFILAKRK